MSRMYIVNHWNNAAAYSGEQIGDRLKDSTALHFNRDGSANTELYSEETALAKKKTSVPLKSRILPQLSRVEKLRSEILELETAYRAGEFSLEEYSVYRDVAFARLQRAEVLYKKAIAAKPIKTEEEYEEDTQQVEAETTYSTYDVHYSHTEVTPCCGVSWIDDLSPRNSFKKILQITCKTTKALVRYTQATKRYIKTLQEV